MRSQGYRVEISRRSEEYCGQDIDSDTLVAYRSYDHLDLPSIMAIHKRFPHVKYFVPLGTCKNSESPFSPRLRGNEACRRLLELTTVLIGNKTWLEGCGIATSSIYELDWWDAKELGAADFDSTFIATDSKASTSTLKLSCVPAQHSSGQSRRSDFSLSIADGLTSCGCSGRGVGDQGQSLWCGWVVEHLSESADPDLASAPEVTDDEAALSDSETMPKTKRRTRTAGKALFVG